MFSPDSTLHPALSRPNRNPRRRQRDSDSLQQQPHRKRSKLSADVFASPSSASLNGKGSLSMNGHASHGETDGSLVLVDMPVREKKPAAKRTTREDGAVLLVRGFIWDYMDTVILTSRQTKCENYSVRKLPSFPPRLCDPRGKSPSTYPSKHPSQVAHQL